MEHHRQMSRVTEPLDLSFLRGATVTRVYLDQYGAGLLLDLAPIGAIYDWRVEQRFQFSRSDEERVLNPQDPPTMLPLVSVLGATVEEARADDGGAIRFKMSGGFAIECASNANYEAWKLEGTNGFLAVCLPGGGLATWDPILGRPGR
jgi:Family of unknown function (DUF6188)